MSELDDTEKRYRLQLIRSQGVGDVTFHRLLDHYGSAGAAVEAFPTLAAKRKSLRLASMSSVEKEWYAVHAYGARYVFFGTDEYPALLTQIASPPPVLTIKGSLDLVGAPCIAIVGARNASAAGSAFASELAAQCADHAITVISGLARGIDAAAHHASLQQGTVAVLAGGLDVIYPKENSALHRDIAKKGLLMSERPFGVQPINRDFPRRNRIIAGLANAVVIIEAAARSGSLVTARYALEHNREIFSVPGSPLDPRNEGCNRLIQEGAALLQSPQEVLAFLQQKELGQAPYSSWTFQEEKDAHRPDPSEDEFWTETDAQNDPYLEQEPFWEKSSIPNTDQRNETDKNASPYADYRPGARSSSTSKLSVEPVTDGPTPFDALSSHKKAADKRPIHQAPHHATENDVPASPIQNSFDGARMQIMEALSYNPVHRDLLIRVVDAPPSTVIAVLQDLVMDGIAIEKSSGHYALAPTSAASDTAAS